MYTVSHLWVLPLLWDPQAGQYGPGQGLAGQLTALSLLQNIQVVDIRADQRLG